MVFAPKNARASFLENAACAYAQTDPATSAHLMAQSRLNNSENGRFASGDLSCRACGTIFLPGFTSRTSVSVDFPVRQGKSRKTAERKRVRVNHKSVRTTCLVCRNYVKIGLPQSSLGSARAASATKGTSIVETKSEDAAKATLTSVGRKPAASNAGSRQRAKARKGGLQAMLEKSKQSFPSSSGSGLDLMDFLKQG